MNHPQDPEYITPEVVMPEVVAGPGKSRLKRWLPFILLGSILICCCGGFGGISSFAIHYFQQEEGLRVAKMVRRHPKVLEQLGGIDECTWNMFADLDAGPDIAVFDVRGPKGRGQLFTFESFYEYRSIILRTPNGAWELIDDDTTRNR